MTILNRTPLSLANVKELIKDELDEKKQMADYLKKFSNLSKEKAEQLAEEIRGLNNLKIKEDDIVKILDFLPKDIESVNKIFTDVSLTEDESNKVLEIIGKY